MRSLSTCVTCPTNIAPPYAENFADNLKRYSSFITVILPIATATISGVPHQQLYLGGTAILIVVGVALDTMKQLQTQLLMRQHRVFIK